MKNLISFLIILSLAVVSISAKTVNSQTNIKTPVEASNGLYQAWRVKNKGAAQKFARADAINKLFSTRWRTMKFNGCEKRGAEDSGGYECIYEDAKIDLSIAMIVKNFRGGYKVTELSFSSEAI